MTIELFLRSGVEPKAKRDRKSTRLNSSHANISYAVFCLKKKSYALFFFKNMRPPYIFFNDTATTDIYSLTLLGALPIFMCLTKSARSLTDFSSVFVEDSLLGRESPPCAAPAMTIELFLRSSVDPKAK